MMISVFWPVDLSMFGLVQPFSPAFGPSGLAWSQDMPHPSKAVLSSTTRSSALQHISGWFEAHFFHEAFPHLSNGFYAFPAILLLVIIIIMQASR